MKRVILVYLISLAAFVSSGQNYRIIDSLKTVLTGLPELNGTDSDTLRMKAVFLLANQYVRVKTDSAKYWYLTVADTVFNEEEIKRYPARSGYNANVLRNLGMTVKNQGNMTDAFRYYNTSLKIATILNDTIKISDCYLSLGITASAQGDYKTATGYTQNALDNFRSINDKKGVSSSLISLGVLLSLQGRYSEAQKYYEDALVIKEEIGDKAGVSKCLNNLGLITRNLGNFSDAREYYLKSLANAEKAGDKSSSSSILVNLGNVSLDQGNFPDAVNYLERALKIQEDMRDQAGIALCLASLGMVTMEQGNYSEAKRLFEAAMEKRELMGDQKGISNCLGNLGAVSNHLGENVKAREYFFRSKQIDERLADSSGIAFCIENLGNIEYLTGNYLKAAEYYDESGRIYNLLKEPTGIASNLVNRGNILMYLGKCSEAAAKYEEALSLYSSFGYISGIINSNTELAKAYICSGNVEKGSELLLKSGDLVLSLLHGNFTIMSEKEKELYLDKTRSVFNDINSFAFRYSEKVDSISGKCYNNELILKGLLLKSTSAVLDAVYNSGNNELRDSYFLLKQIRNQLSELNASSDSLSFKEISFLEAKSNEVEKKLVRLSGEVAGIQELFSYKWEDVRDALSENEAAVEFIQIREGSSDDTVQYAALVITHGCKQPVMVDLFSDDEIVEIVGRKVQTGYSFVNTLYKTKGSKIYNMIWSPLDKYLEGTTQVYYSPTGLLHNISFAALHDSSGKYLCEKYGLYQVSTTGIILNRKSDPIEVRTAVVFGGIDYSSVAGTKEYWGYLPGTMEEKELVAKRLIKGGVACISYSGKDASEIVFKTQFDSLTIPEIVHISTHGFFYPDPDHFSANSLDIDDASNIKFRGTKGFGNWMFIGNKNPMMRSGLVFSGANRIWSEEWGRDNNEGMLTAYEVSNLNMRSTKLVVLSACETGLGDIKGSEGVYGLQRAFKMAGVKSIIISLWQLPDKETTEFMDVFYKKLVKYKDVRVSFNEAREEFMKKYDPFYWGSFLLVE